MQKSSLKIGVTSDSHLGFIETDPTLKDDSFNAFEECL
jgi:DNA repair exonuclease SbcCD nuclease subunit